HAGDGRAGWWVLAELCERLDAGLGTLTAPLVTAKLAGAVPCCAGIDAEEIGGKGVRWQERDAASAAPEADASADPLAEPPEPPEGLRVWSARTLWSGPEVAHSPALSFLSPRPVAE